MAALRNLVVGSLWALLVLGGPVSSATAHAPSRTHGPNDRQYWRDGFDINSDYTAPGVAPAGKLVEYNWTLGQTIVDPDGYQKLAMTVNGQYPGPPIIADWGDTVRVNVFNNFTENHNGTAIHMHGLRQLNTNWQDGVPGVTQCPSKPGDTQVYEFTAHQYGKSWYHGHLSLQYSNGLYGAIQINGPTSANYDEDLGPWLLADWYHDDVFSLEYIGVTTFLAAIPETTVLNGQGSFDCNPKNDTRCTGTSGPYESVVQKNKKYKIGIINPSTLLTYTWWIDGHNLTVVATDFVPIQPYVTDVLNVGIGQRYEVIIETTADLTNGTNFWINAQYCAEPEILPYKVGVLRYDGNDKSDPYSPPQKYIGHGCSDPHPSNLVPVVKKNVGPKVNGNGTFGKEKDNFLGVGQQAYPDPYDYPGKTRAWVLRDTPMYLDWSDPTLKKLTLDTDPSFPVETVPLTLDYETGEWVYFLISSNYSVGYTNIPRNLTPSVHPMHLHGHDFFIIGQGEGVFPNDTVPLLENPPRRDVIDIDIGSWIWIAFQIDNPGAWLFHCHIAFHASGGLALQFIEQPSKIKPLLQSSNVLGEFDDRCNAFSNFYQTVNIPANATQDDSGI